MRKMKDSGIEWIGEIPEGWETRRMKTSISERCGGNWGEEQTNSLGDMVCLRIADFDYPRLSFQKNINYTIRNYPKKIIDKLILKKGDILIEKSGGGEKTPVGRAVIFDLDISALYANFMERLRVCSFVLPMYFLYNLSIFYDNRYVLNYINQTTGIQNLDLTALLDKEAIPLPPLSDQKRIADYLDEKCGRIDAAIEKQKQVIEKLQEYKRSLITQTVTKGLNPKAKMKDSGIEWIGEIPESWEKVRIKNVFTLRNERSFLPLNQVNLISLYTDKGVLQHSDLDETNTASGNKASNADGYKKVFYNDIIVNIILCWMGAIGRSQYEGVTSPAYDVYKPSDSIECRYYHYFFRTPGFNGDCYKNGRGIMAMRWRTYSTEFMAISIPLPPLSEQRQIADYLDERCASIDSVIAKKSALIEKLTEYKKSLIYETVTGKREI